MIADRFNLAVNNSAGVIGKKGAERLLKLSIELFNPKIQKEEVVIDTTVQETSPIPLIPNWPKSH